MKLTDRQLETIDRWADDNATDSELERIERITSSGTLTRQDIDYLRSISGFSDIEDKVIPRGKSTMAKKVVADYGKYEDIPTAWREEQMEKYDLSEDDLKKAIDSQRKAKSYADVAADMEARKRMLDESKELSTDRGLIDNAISLGLKLVPKEAERYYIRHGVKDDGSFLSNKGLAASTFLGHVANTLELLPIPFLASTIAPVALRKIEAHTTGEPEDYTLGDMGADAGLNALSYLPVKAIFDLTKGQFGSVVGANLEKNQGVKSTLERALTAVDNADDLGKLEKKEAAQETFSKSVGSALRRHDALMKYPALRKNDKVTKGTDKVSWERKARQAENLGLNDMASNIREYNLADTPEARQAAHDAIVTESKNISTHRKLEYDDTSDRFGTSAADWYDPDVFTKQQKQYTLDKYIAAQTPKWARRASTAFKYGGRPAWRLGMNPRKDSPTRLSDDELRLLERQWKAGFVPHGGIELEYYNAWKRGELK